MMNKTVILGAINKIPVLVEYPCSDVCPEYTARIIRYDIPISGCEAIGGIILETAVPWGITQIMQEYCSPFGLTIKTDENET